MALAREGRGFDRSMAAARHARRDRLLGAAAQLSRFPDRRTAGGARGLSARDRTVLASRLAERKGPLRPPSFLDRQLDILEEPDPDENPIHVDVSRPIEDVVADILRELDPQLPADPSAVTARVDRPSVQWIH